MGIALVTSRGACAHGHAIRKREIQAGLGATLTWDLIAIDPCGRDDLD